MITLSGVTKAFGPLVVLRDLSLTLAPGMVTAVLGPNGSGKTTLGRLLLGLETPTSGSIAGLVGLLTHPVQICFQRWPVTFCAGSMS